MKISNKELANIITEETLVATQKQRSLDEGIIKTGLKKIIGKGATHGEGKFKDWLRGVLDAPNIGKVENTGDAMRNSLKVLDGTVPVAWRLNINPNVQGQLTNIVRNFESGIDNAIAKIENKFWKPVNHTEFKKTIGNFKRGPMKSLEFRIQNTLTNAADELDVAKRISTGTPADAAKIAKQEKLISELKSAQTSLGDLRKVLDDAAFPEEVYVALRKTRSTDVITGRVSKHARRQAAAGRAAAPARTAAGAAGGAAVGITYSLAKKAAITYAVVEAAMQAGRFFLKDWILEWADGLSEPYRSGVKRWIRSTVLTKVLLDLFLKGTDYVQEMLRHSQDILNAGPDEPRTKLAVELFVNHMILLKLLSRGDYKANFYKDQYTNLKEAKKGIFRAWKSGNKGKFEARGGFNEWLASQITLYTDQVIQKSNNIEKDLADVAKQGDDETSKIIERAFLYYLALNVERRYGIKISAKDVSHTEVREQISNNLEKIPAAARSNYKRWVETDGREPWSQSLKIKLLLNVPAIKKDIQSAAVVTKKDLVSMAQNL